LLSSAAMLKYLSAELQKYPDNEVLAGQGRYHTATTIFI